MPCTPLAVDAAGTVAAWICSSGKKKVISEEDAGVRWCFNCRKHLPHTDVWTADVEPSYYDPNWSRLCTQCHGDHSLFPGRVWVWQE